MTWWIWALLGLGLLAFELLTPGTLFALFFGIGALLVALLAALEVHAAIQWITFAVVSVALVVLVRGRVQRRLQQSAPSEPIDTLVGEEVLLLGDLPAGGEAKAELRGVPWSARAASGIPLAKGQRCKVERVDGVVLYVIAA
jgi:membrane protein implicated in regulation of membrane protease activity